MNGIMNETKKGEDQSIDYSRWKIIYPNYINKVKKVKEGRRLNLQYCVRNPTVENLERACQELKVPFIVEKNKCYPRDWQVEGRIRVKLPNTQSTISTKWELMKQIGLKLQELKVNNESDLPTPTVTPLKKRKKKEKK